MTAAKEFSVRLMAVIGTKLTNSTKKSESSICTQYKKSRNKNPALS
jgi:hypothetical protein